MNYILKDENAVYFECGYSCDNEIFLSLNGRNFLLTDSRYALEATEAVESFARSGGKECEVIEIKRSLVAEVRVLLRKFRVKSLVFDPLDFSHYEFNALSKDSLINFAPKINFSKQKRIIKSQNEIEILKKAATFGARKFDEFASFINEFGLEMSEKELFFNASNILKDRGSLGLSFEPIVAINENAAKAHALPTKKALKDGDLLLVDAGVKYKRYCSDRTRTANFSKEFGLNFSKNQSFKNSKMAEIYDIVKEAQSLAIKAIKPGVMACEIDKVARDFIAKMGYEDKFIHSTGHGIGLDIHELPNINRTDKTILKKGMVFSVEPGIYLSGEFGVRIEDAVVVTEDGCEIL